MNIQNDSKSTNPVAREIVFNPATGNVHSSDFSPFRTPGSDIVYVHDIIDTNSEQAFYQVMSAAMGSPAMEVESDVVFRGAKVHVHVTYADSPEPRIRVLVSSDGSA